MVPMGVLAHRSAQPRPSSTENKLPMSARSDLLVSPIVVCWCGDLCFFIDNNIIPTALFRVALDCWLATPPPSPHDIWTFPERILVQVVDKQQGRSLPARDML